MWVLHTQFYTKFSINNLVIQHKEHFRGVSLPQFLQDMKALQKDYDNDFAKAITGHDEYKMRYSHLDLTTNN